MSNDRKYSGEMEMAGFYAGGVLGGLTFGAAGDILALPVNSMAMYITGAVVGALGGALAATVFRRVIAR